MTRTTGALAEFVLARIWEEEANVDARTVPHGVLVEVAPGVQVWHTFGADMPMNELHGGAGQWVIRTDPGRLRADCVAKRRMVLLATELDPEFGTRLLRIMATPYRRHPEFRDEWQAESP